MKHLDLLEERGERESDAITLAIVIPCYNEQEMLPTTTEKLLGLFNGLISTKRITTQSRICLVDDGSTDATWDVIEQVCQKSRSVTGIRLTRNFGHQNALLAGMLSSNAEAVITMDADLQDDLGVIAAMLDEYKKAKDVVYGVRKSREADKFFKRVTAHAFYGIMRWMGVEIIPDHADFRLLSARAIRWLREFPEVDLFLRGLVPQLSSNSSLVYYERGPRLLGKTKYSLRKMLAFAWRGVTSTTTFPLRLVTLTGFLIFIVSIAMTLRTVFVKIFTNTAVTGWASTVVPIYVLGGLQILCLGIIGEYVTKIFLETKHRPRFLVEKRIGGHRRSERMAPLHKKQAFTESMREGFEPDVHLIKPL